MRDPRFWRNVALAVLASGGIAGFAAAGMGDGAETVRGALFGYAASALVLGGGSAFFRRLDVRAEERLRGGEGVLARWHVDAATWRAFADYDRERNREEGGIVNELVADPWSGGEGVDVVVGRAAVSIGGSVHRLPERGTPEVERAELNVGRVRPSFIELRLRHPGGGHGAAGVPRSSTVTALRFPVPPHALALAEQVVAHYAGERKGEADFFHGKGNGSDPEDISACVFCGYETHRFVSHCPRCGHGVQSRRWSRRFGAALAVCGLLISAGMGAVLFTMTPLLLRPGVSVGGTRFSGTPTQAILIFGLLVAILTLGVATTLYGLWQTRTGRRDRRVIYFAMALALALLVTAWAIYGK
jgi:hypothetical protein